MEKLLSILAEVNGKENISEEIEKLFPKDLALKLTNTLLKNLEDRQEKITQTKNIVEFLKQLVMAQNKKLFKELPFILNNFLKSAKYIHKLPTQNDIKNYIEEFLSLQTLLYIHSKSKAKGDNRTENAEKIIAKQVVFQMLSYILFGVVEIPITLKDFPSKITIAIEDSKSLVIKLEIMSDSYGYISCKLSLAGEKLFMELVAQSESTGDLIKKNVHKLLSAIEKLDFEVVGWNVKINQDKKTFDTDYSHIGNILSFVDKNI